MELRTTRSVGLYADCVPNNIHVKIDILVVRVTKGGEKSIGMAKPCYTCLTWLKSVTSLDIRHVFYTTDEGTLNVERLEEMSTEHRCSGIKFK